MLQSGLTKVVSLLFMFYSQKTFEEISESEPEDETNPDHESPEDSDVENDENSLHWCEEDVQGLMQDLNESLPEPPLQQPMLNRVNLLLRWLCCFILYWEVVTRVSDAAVEWLLAFLGKFFEILSCELESQFFKNLILFFPTTMYALHRISSLRRDEFESLLFVENGQNCTISMNAWKGNMEQSFRSAVRTFCFLLAKQSIVEASS